MSKLLLFDIDGTLLMTNGVSRLTLIGAICDVCHIEISLEGYQFGGKTDAQIVSELLLQHGVPEQQIPSLLTPVYTRMGQLWEPHIPSDVVTLCPGIRPLLTILAQRPDVVIGLLTGNAEHTALQKVRSASLNASLFKVGAYGNESADRNDLPAIAMQRASQMFKTSFTGKNTVIIGDTLADIACARAGSATAVAVATGFTSYNTLKANRPDHLFDNLADTDRVVQILTG